MGLVMNTVQINEYCSQAMNNWGEPERAPHRRVCCGISLYIYMYIYMYIYLVRRAVSHFRLLFCEFLRHSLIQKLLINYSSRRHELLYLLDGNSNDRRPLVDLPIQ